MPTIRVRTEQDNYAQVLTKQAERMQLLSILLHGPPADAAEAEQFPAAKSVDVTKVKRIKENDNDVAKRKSSKCDK